MSIDTRRCTALLAAGLMLPLPVLAGCESGGDAVSTAARHDVAPAHRNLLRQGGTLHWAWDAKPATFNTFQADADAGTERIAGAVLPALFTLDNRGRPHRNQDYLRRAEVVQRQPQQIVRYKLHPEAVWSDGRPIQVADFVAQWKALRGADNAYWTARNAGYERIAKIAPGGEAHEVEVTFAKPYADWAQLFTPLYPKGVMGSPDAFNDQARTKLAVGAGPFLMQGDGAGARTADPEQPAGDTGAAGPTSSAATDDQAGGEAGKRAGDKARDDKTVTLIRNPRWWGRPARLDRIVFHTVPLSERAAALAAGTLDIAAVDRATADRIEGATDAKGGPRRSDAARSADALRAWAGRHGSAADRAAYRQQRKREARQAALRRLRVRRALEPAYTQLALNGSEGPLADERVRRAVARAVDRKALADDVLGRLGLPAQPLGHHLLMAGQQGYRDQSRALGKQGAQAAQALLTEAGWRIGASTEHPKELAAGSDGRTGKSGARSGPAAVRTKNGKALALRFVLPSGPGSATLRSVGHRIARMLGGIGVRVEITKVKDSSYFTDYIASGDFDLALYSWPATAFPATDARPVFAKPQPAADGSLVVEQNYSRVGTDHIDQLFEQAASELDAGAARRLVGRADARIWAAAGSIPLFQRPELVAVDKDLANAGAFGFMTPRYQDIGFRKG